MLHGVREQLKFFVQNKIYMISLVLAAVAGYGYEWTHATCGVDDIAISVYFEDGLGVAIGRWPYYLMNKVFPICPYRGAIIDVVMVLFLMLAAILFAGLLRLTMQRELSIWVYVVFSVFFLDYSLIVPVFVYYLQNGIGYMYCLSAAALYGFYHYYSGDGLCASDRIRTNLGVMICLWIGISFYESGACVVLFGALLVLLVDLCGKQKLYPSGGKRHYFVWILQRCWYIARMIIYAMVLRSAMRIMLMKIFHIPEFYFYRNVTVDEKWLNGWESVRDVAWNIRFTVKRDYYENALNYYPILLFVMTSILYLGFVIAYVVYHRKDHKRAIWIGILGIGAYASLFVLSVINCSAMPYRSCQQFVLLVAGVLALSTDVLLKQRKWIRNAGCFVVGLVLVLDIVDINRWFIFDYKRTAYSMNMLAQIAEDLTSGAYNIENKPIAIMGQHEDYPYKNMGAIAQMDEELITWSIDALHGYCTYDEATDMLMRSLGYEFQWMENDTYKAVRWDYFWDYFETGYKQEKYNSSEQYPCDGYIKELEDYIIIKL